MREEAGTEKIISELSSNPLTVSTLAFLPSRDVANPEAPPMLREDLEDVLAANGWRCWTRVCVVKAVAVPAIVAMMNVVFMVILFYISSNQQLVISD